MTVSDAQRVAAARGVPLAVVRPRWAAPSRVRAFTTLRGLGLDGDTGVSAPPFDRFNLGSRCGDDPAAVACNRTLLQEACGLPSAPRWLRQVHGTAVVACVAEGAAAALDVEAPAAPEPEADAARTTDPDVVLAILTADCLPVLLCAADGSEVAAAHAGWRGLAAGVLEATVAAMTTPPHALIAWLGPAAGPTAYEIGVEVRDAFVSADPDAATAFVPTQPGHWRCDLYALARRRLASVGVTAASGGEHCTIGEPQRFYSHRRDGRSGRMASLIWIGSRR